MKGGRERFGAFIRREREAKEIGLREMAKKIGVSPTYLSKIERDEFPPPVEGKVKAIAKIIDVCIFALASGLRPIARKPLEPSQPIAMAGAIAPTPIAIAAASDSIIFLDKLVN